MRQVYWAVFENGGRALCYAEDIGFVTFLLDESSSGFSYEMLKAAERIYGPLTFVQLQTLAHGYGDWQGYWGHYLRALRTS